MKAYKKRMAGAVAAALALTGSGCGGAADAVVPSLVEPAAVTSAYRPAERVNIGNVTVLYATVAAEDTPYFFETAVTLSEVTVEVGDTVKAGDVLARADIGQEEETLAALRKELETEQKTYAINNKITEQQILEIGYRREREEAAQAGADGAEDVEVAEDYDAEIAELRENQRYDSLLHEFRVQRIESEIAQAEEVIAEGTLVAESDGTVTYVKTVSGATSVSALEEVVTVSDLGQLHLELPVDMYFYEELYQYDSCEAKYLIADGVRYDLEEIPYSADERILAKTYERYPNARLTYPEGSGYALGEVCAVCFVEEETADVLAVANDSLYTDGENAFVYVKNADGEKEKRVVETGASDDLYTQVTSGLAEGELVYFDSASAIPYSYGEYTVKLSDFSCAVTLSGSYSLSDSQMIACASELEGELVEVDVYEGDTVEAGDLLYIIDTGQGAAALSDSEMQIARQESSYQLTLKSYEEQEKAIRESEELSAGEKQCELLILSYQKELFLTSYEQTMESLLAAYETLSGGNDGTGKISVYAAYSGTISNVSASFYEGEQITEGKVLFYYSQQTKNKLAVQMDADSIVSTNATENPAAVGAAVQVLCGDTVYTGICSGVRYAGSSVVHCGTRDGEAYLSYQEPLSRGSDVFYVRMEDESAYEEMDEGGSLSFTYLSVKGAVSVPASLIYTEEGVDKVSRCYVWKLEGDDVVKQYVTRIDEINSSLEKVILSGVSEGDVLVDAGN